MNVNDRLLHRLNLVGYGLAAVTLLSIVLGWSPIVQYASFALLVLTSFGTGRAAARMRHERARCR